MKNVLASVLSILVLVLLLGPSPLAAKGKTTKIVIQGQDLSMPIEIADANRVEKFQIWTGPGTSSNQSQSFIVDWSAGPIKELPKDVKHYEVSFYVNEHHLDERVAYVVIYAVDLSTKSGYVYIPGPSDKYFNLDVHAIQRGVEGNWFRAWSVWDNVAGPLISKVTTGKLGFEEQSIVAKAHQRSARKGALLGFRRG